MSNFGPGTSVPITSLRLVGGHSALDFVNTVTGRLTAEPIDFLPDFDALMLWSCYAGVVDESECDACVAAAARRGSASAVFRRALVLREALYEIFSARTEDEPLADVSLDALNRELDRGAQAWRLARAGRRVRWQWPPDDPALSLARVSSAAAVLLTDELAPRLGRCAGIDHGCAWLFLDTSRGGTRRWCSMDACGNRAKARAHYRRTHTA
jgi:predicted RNA-binding Zn ribbon-like protein